MSDVPNLTSDNWQPVGDLSQPFDVAVVIPTILREGLLRAVRSIYAQDFTGRVQILVGIDGASGSRHNLEILQEECPADAALCILDPGYSTAKQNGGLYSASSGGSLRTVLSYMAHSEFVAYLDDDNMFAPNHLSALCEAIDGHDWAFSHRWFVDPATLHPVCIDEWGVGWARAWLLQGEVQRLCRPQHHPARQVEMPRCAAELVNLAVRGWSRKQPTRI